MSIRLIKLAVFKRKFAKFGAKWCSGGKHFYLEREIDGHTFTYPVPVQKGGKQVLEIYIKHGRRALKMTPEDDPAVTNEDFDSA